ncbi:MAG: GNAT family N-acetyltransferase [Lewinellaceae bacterium]|nr:GNAT family N-acetyltransferase [Saprospiraceae bacterium]MCB9340250.1 GNAT family N-acetyltransferase [Lewinellaceae bacterium]
MLELRPAQKGDIPLILQFIKDLAEYERLSDIVVANEELLEESLFGDCRYAEVVLAYYDGQPAGFALFFHNYSTFLARPGIYLEDLFVKPEFRRKSIGKALLSHLAQIALDRKCGRLEWSVLDWNTPAIDFYKSIGAKAMDEWTVFRLTGESLNKLAES